MKWQRSAFELWHKSYPYRESDQLVEYFFNCDIRTNWLERARSALFLSINRVAQKAGVSKQYLYKIERSEHTGNIKISTIKKIAEAMDCELVYAIRPKSKELFGKIIWEVLDKAATENYRGFNPAEGIESRKAWFGKSKIMDGKFRKKQNWSKRKPKNFDDF